MPSRSWLSNETSFHRRWTALCVADHNDASIPCMKRPAWARKMNPTSESTENIRRFIADRTKAPRRHNDWGSAAVQEDPDWHCLVIFFAEVQPNFLLWSQALTPFRKSWPQVPPSQQLFHRSMQRLLLTLESIENLVKLWGSSTKGQSTSCIHWSIFSTIWEVDSPRRFAARHLANDAMQGDAYFDTFAAPRIESSRHTWSNGTNSKGL